MSNTQTKNQRVSTVMERLHVEGGKTKPRRLHNLAEWTSLGAYNAIFGAASAPVLCPDLIHPHHLLLIAWPIFLLMIFMYPTGMAITAGQFARSLYMEGGRAPLIGLMGAVTSLVSWAVVISLVFETV